jgi:tetratricopeptide (TPR) repeat protein
MDGFYVRDAAPFEAWLTVQAESSRRLFATVLQHLAAAQASDGAYESAATTTRRLIAVDPLHERAYRDLMLFQAWLRDRQGAVETYRSLVSALDIELGVSPLSDTTELYESILAAESPDAPTAERRPTVIVERVAPPVAPLVGRDAVLKTAMAVLAAQTGMVVVTGDTGAGITRLLDEIGSQLRADGATVLTATGSFGAAEVPYGVVQDALFDVIEGTGFQSQLDGLSLSVITEASRLFPGLSPGAVASPESSSRAGFLDALARLIGVLDTPVLIVDDAQHCDAASAEALSFFAARAARIGLRMVIATTSDHRPNAATQLMLHDLSDRATFIKLEPLSVADIEELIDWSGLDLEPTSVLDASGGLPLFILGVLRSGAAGKSPAIPDQLRRVVTARLADVDGVARQILDAVAVIDRPADALLVAAVAGKPLDESDLALDLLITQGLVSESEDGSVSVTHTYIANHVMEGATVARRRVLHRRAAAALEARSQMTGGAARVARHHALAGEHEDASKWFTRAGHEASQIFAHSEAVFYYEEALASGHADRAALHRAIAKSHLLDGKYDRALVAFEAAVAAGDPDRAGAEHHIGEIHRRLRRWDLAAAHFDAALSLADDSELRSVICSDRAYVEGRRSHAGDPEKWLSDALALATESGSSRALTRAHNILGLMASDAASRHGHLRTALTHATDAAERVAVLNNLAKASDPAAAVEFAHEAIDLASSIQDRHLSAALHNTLADALHDAGDSDGSKAALKTAVELFSEITADGDDGWLPEVWFLTEW